MASYQILCCFFCHLFRKRNFAFTAKVQKAQKPHIAMNRLITKSQLGTSVKVCQKAGLALFIKQRDQGSNNKGQFKDSVQE
jgi:hypothetical protein